MLLIVMLYDGRMSVSLTPLFYQVLSNEPSVYMSNSSDDRVSDYKLLIQQQESTAQNILISRTLESYCYSFKRLEVSSGLISSLRPKRIGNQANEEVTW